MTNNNNIFKDLYDESKKLSERGLVNDPKLNFTNKFSQAIEELEKIIEDDPDRAYAELILVFDSINEAIERDLSILKKLDKWLNKLKGVVEKIGKKFNAVSFDISYSFPGKLSISLSFLVI